MKSRQPSDSEMLFAKLGPITYRKPDELVAYAKHARRHPKRQLVALAASIREFGFTMPVLVDADDVIIAGHARVEAARSVGLSEVPVISATHLSPAQVRAYRLADNRLPELGQWNAEALVIELREVFELGEIQVESLGWSTGELDVMFDASATGDCDGDEEAAGLPANDPVARPGDLWLLGKHKLLCGSALESSSWERLLAGEQARMIFTDPPFNLAVNGHVSGLGKVKHAEFAMASGEMSEGEFTAFLSDFLKAMLPYVVDGAVVDICMDWRHLRELLSAVDKNDLSLLNLCVWAKTNGGMGSLYRSRHELVLITKVGTAPHINNVELGKHGRYRTNVWDYAGANSFGSARMADLADHPTVKPTILVADAIRDVTNLGDIVLDAFMGSGTTLLAADTCDRIAYGTEIEPGYIDVAIKRWSKRTGGTAILDRDGRSWDEIAEARRVSGDGVSALLIEEASDVAA